MAVGDTYALLRSIRGHTQLPTAQITFDDAATLEVATEELHSYLLPTLLQERQEFWTGAPARISYPVVTGQALYPISPRAAGAKVRSARLLDVTNSPVPLATYELEDVNRWAQDNGMPSGVVLENNYLRLFPTPQNLPDYRLEVQTYLRPARLVTPLEESGTITLVNQFPSTTVVRFNYYGDEQVFIDSPTVDVVSARPIFETMAANAQVLSFDTIISNTLYEMTLAGNVDANEGDYLCVPETAPVVQAPLEWHPLLALKVAVRQLASVGDVELAGAKASELKEKEGKCGIVIRPRREDAGRKVRNGTAKWRNGVPSTW